MIAYQSLARTQQTLGQRKVAHDPTAHGTRLAREYTKVLSGGECTASNGTLEKQVRSKNLVGKANYNGGREGRRF